MTTEPDTSWLDDPELGLDAGVPDPFPSVAGWVWPPGPRREAGDSYGAMIANLRSMLDHLAGADPDDDTVAALTADLAEWRRRLAPSATREDDQVFGRRRDLPGRGQTMVPALVVREADRDSVHATVRFGRYYLGGGGAVHGGAIPLLFDEVLGRLCNSDGRQMARTASLHTDYRAIVPVGVELEVRGWFVSVEGRKCVLRAELRDGDTICAEAEGLFVVLNPGQP